LTLGLTSLYRGTSLYRMSRYTESWPTLRFDCTLNICETGLKLVLIMGYSLIWFFRSACRNTRIEKSQNNWFPKNIGQLLVTLLSTFQHLWRILNSRKAMEQRKRIKNESIWRPKSLVWFCCSMPHIKNFIIRFKNALVHSNRAKAIFGSCDKIKCSLCLVLLQSAPYNIIMLWMHTYYYYCGKRVRTNNQWIVCDTQKDSWCRWRGWS